MSKKKRRPQQKHTVAPVRSSPRELLDGLDEAESLMRRRRWDEAREILLHLDQRYPDRPEVLGSLMDVCHELRDRVTYEDACERLHRLRPDDADLTLALAASHMLNLHVFLALRTCRHFLERWPYHPQADYARETVTEVEPEIGSVLEQLGLTGEDALELATLHEEAQALLSRGKLAQAQKTGEQLLRRRPDFVPALNNLSLIHSLEGQTTQAVAIAQRVLDLEPDNFHALANLTRFLVLAGSLEEARRWADRLKAVQSARPDVWAKRAEALSYLGDDADVMDAFHAFRDAHSALPAPDHALLCHLAAVAAMRLGRENDARRLWQEALKQMPGFDLAQSNLDDLRRPIGERHAPWPFSLRYWIHEAVIQDLFGQLEPLLESGDEETLSRAIRRHLRRYPEIERLVPLLLDRGDPPGREFAIRAALTLGTPETLEALREFALGQRGPDAMRFEAAMAAAQAGLFPPGPVSLWTTGERQEVLLFGFEIHGEPDEQHSPQVEELATEAMAAVHRGDGVRAEQLFRRALEIEPDSPRLSNNLALAYELQGRRQESQALLRQVHERFPDYFFGRTGMAMLHVARGETKEAEALLQPLLFRQRLHFSELAALAEAQIVLLLAEGKRDAARAWYEMWASADPDHRLLDRWRHLEASGRPKPRPDRKPWSFRRRD